MTQTVLLKNARLIDGLVDQPQVGMSILVTGERISKVERGEIPAPPDAQVIDVGGTANALQVLGNPRSCAR